MIFCVSVTVLLSPPAWYCRPPWIWKPDHWWPDSADWWRYDTGTEKKWWLITNLPYYIILCVANIM